MQISEDSLLTIFILKMGGNSACLRCQNGSPNPEVPLVY
jgi:hypothetical protein